MSALQVERFEPVQSKPLTRNQIDAALLCPEIFIDSHCWIRGEGGRTVRFHLWPEQREVVQAFDEGGDDLVLKARQLGISWLSDGYALWLASANRGQTILIFSKGQREADAELARIRFMHARLPPELRHRTADKVPGSKEQDNLSTIAFPDMDSRIISLPPTQDGGTSFTATLVIVQELAKIQFDQSLMAGITPTMADGGRLFVISTAKGYSGVFHDYWQENQHRLHAGQVVGDRGTDMGSFRPIFIPWTARPGRTQEWYDATARKLPAKEMRQEFPFTPAEAFQGSTDAVFGEEFDRRTHGLDGGYERTNVYAVVGGTDPGLNNAVAHLIEVQGRLAWVFAEIHLENQSVEELGQAIYARCQHFGLDPTAILIYVDPFDVGRNMQTMKTDRDVLAEQGLLVDREDERYSPAQRVGLIKVLLKQARLFISTDCPKTLDALERAPWKTHRAPNGEQVRDDCYAKDSKYEHFLDSLGTALARIFPPQAPAAAETTGSTFSAEQFAYSGSQFG